MSGEHRDRKCEWCGRDGETLGWYAWEGSELLFEEPTLCDACHTFVSAPLPVDQPARDELLAAQKTMMSVMRTNFLQRRARAN